MNNPQGEIESLPPGGRQGGTTPAASPRRTVVLGDAPLRPEDVVAVACGEAGIELAAERVRRTAQGNRRFTDRLAQGDRIYGVTTGFGESCLNEVDPEYLSQMPLNLIRFHGCGTGATLGEEASAAVLAAVLASLGNGWSAARPEVLQRLCELLEHRILPCIPAEGSVGASGDLTPLSYVAAVLVGEREVHHRGRILDAATALSAAGLIPLTLGPKESLAVMNGTSVMTALLCLAIDRARRVARLAAILTAGASEALRGNPGHFDERIFAAKPHPGQQLCARWIREDLAVDLPARNGDGRIQDRYSIRCAPHVIGVLIDALSWVHRWTGIELNSSCDNPLIDPDTGEALHGGNFYGGHVCFAADALKTAVANVADLLDRQLLLLCSRETGNGLPENLVAREGPERTAHHGFKAMQIAASALTAEALKATVPASAFSRSTESHNQDKVSMGTIAARDCLRVLELTETVAAIAVLGVCQAVDLRGGARPGGAAFRLHEAVRRRIPLNDRDRRQDHDIAAVLRMLRGRELPIGEAWA